MDSAGIITLSEVSEEVWFTCNFTGSDRNAHHPPSQPAHAGNDKASSEWRRTSLTGSDNHGRLFYVHDRITGTRFLVDTVLKWALYRLRIRQTLSFEVQCYIASRKSVINRHIWWTFNYLGPWFAEDIQMDIHCGWYSDTHHRCDFLKAFGLLVDIKHRKLYDSNTHLSVNGICADQSPPSISPMFSQPTDNSPYHAILRDFPELHVLCTIKQGWNIQSNTTLSLMGLLWPHALVV